eukprot:TRINITY_DN1216_c0_g1_i10.p1 TRINITY_DN1216_c0_g1~~TRINITY_DN1216_c0_g1_i10.p1  ORF type:complete len:154 (-),score=64.72 TRINITY_DN1216_c0_g1_i10:153-614(-)
MKEEEQEIIDYVRDTCEKILVVNNKRVVPKKGRKRHKAQPGSNLEEEKEVHSKPKYKKLRPEKTRTESAGRKHIKKDKEADKPKEEKKLRNTDMSEEKPEDVLVVSDEDVNKVKAGSEAKMSGIVNVESKKNLKRKKVKEKLLGQQQTIEKWN